MAIHIKKSKVGSLHKALGVPKGEKIPASKLKKNSNDSPAMAKKKNFARNAKKWKHPDGGEVKPDYTGWGIEFTHNNSNVAKSTYKGNIINKIVANNITPYGTGLGHPEYVIDNEKFAKLSTDYKNKQISTQDRRNLIRKFAYNPDDNNKMKPTGSLRPVMPANINASEDALRLHQGLQQKYNSFVYSKYAPSNAKDTVPNHYYSFSPNVREEIIKDLTLYQNSDFINSSDTIRKVKGSIVGQGSLKNFTYSKGEDKNGKYISYYDINDYGNLLDKIGKPFEIYDRIYLNEMKKKKHPDGGEVKPKNKFGAVYQTNDVPVRLTQQQAYDRYISNANPNLDFNTFSKMPLAQQQTLSSDPTFKVIQLKDQQSMYPGNVGYEYTKSIKGPTNALRPDGSISMYNVSDEYVYGKGVPKALYGTGGTTFDSSSGIMIEKGINPNTNLTNTFDTFGGTSDINNSFNSPYSKAPTSSGWDTVSKYGSPIASGIGLIGNMSKDNTLSANNQTALQYSPQLSKQYEKLIKDQEIGDAVADTVASITPWSALFSQVGEGIGNMVSPNKVGEKSDVGAMAQAIFEPDKAIWTSATGLYDAIKGKKKFEWGDLIGMLFPPAGAVYQNDKAKSLMSSAFNELKRSEQSSANSMWQGYAAKGGVVPFANGGLTPGGTEIEVEKDEVMRDPNDGSMVEFNGPTHAQGGIDINAEPGSQIFGKLKVKSGQYKGMRYKDAASTIRKKLAALEKKLNS